jgi:3-hydroxybutyryl-CoA dehydratase
MKGKTIGELKTGDSASFEKTMSEADVYLFAGITGDLNPAHINAQWAAESMFKQRVVHGVLTAGLISTVLGTLLPGPGTIYLGQELKFTAPVFFGDTIRAEVTVTELRADKNLCKLSTVCTNQNGVVVVEGAATVKPPK